MQCGAVTLIAVILLITVVTFSALVAALYTNTGVNDTLNQDDSTAALFLAETGLENAAYNFSASGTCDSAGVGVGTTNYGRGSFEIVSGVTSGLYCQITTYGIIGSVRRTAQADVQPGGGAIAAAVSSTSPPWSTFNATAVSWSYNVPATGSNRLLVVGISWRADAGQTVSLVRYNGVNMTLGAGPVTRTSAGTSISTATYYLVNPATGANNVTFTVSGSGSRGIVGAAVFSGVDQTTPRDNTAATASGATNSPQPSISVTTVTANAWVFSVGGVVGGNSLTATNGTQIWGPNAQTGGGGPHAEGAASYRGPIATPGAASMTWSAGTSGIWVLAAFPIRPAATGSPSIFSWTEP